MDFFPIFLALKNKPCLIVGGGNIAARKASLLRKADAKIYVVAPELCPELQHAVDDGKVHHKARFFEDSDIQGMTLIIASTDNKAINAHVSTLAQAENIPINVVDDRDLCSFIVPSVLDRSPVMIAVSTGGASPVLARQLRSRLETMIPSSCSRLATITYEYREKVKAALPPESRMRFWEDALHGSFGELVMAGQEEQARALLEASLKNNAYQQALGEVYLVGAGPGDPDLLTFRALRLMQRADVVVYDRLVSKSILDMTRRDAERFYVGKEKDNHAVPQDKINDLLVELAQQGKRVLRLKGGDPFIFGRGGEEIETLAENGVPFQVVPGITAASGCASYSGIPLTHRDYAQSVTFATGHLKDGTVNLAWEQMIQPRQTLVFYMGLTGISVISKELIAHGMPADMPAALVEQGTTRNQRVHIGTISSLPDLVQKNGVHAPTLTIVGEVVNLHEKLDWYRPEKHVQASEFSKNPPKRT